MPGPLPLRGLQTVHQSRFPALDDDKVSVSMTSSSLSSASAAPSSSPSSSVYAASSLSEHHPMMFAQKRARRDVHKVMQEAVARESQPAMKPAHDGHDRSLKPSHFSTQKIDHLDTESHRYLDELNKGSSKHINIVMHEVNNLDKGSLKPGSSAMGVRQPKHLAALASTQSMLSENVSEPHMQEQMRECPTSIQANRIGDEQFLCLEVAGRGAQWKYTLKQQPGKKGGSVFNVVDMKLEQNPLSDLIAFVRSCVVPEGFPDSVAPSYTPYMQWRALKYLFGGAMSVFTTRSLLHAVGISQHGAASTAMAVNWVIKDGAGRVGKLLFARHGKKFDYDMKQLRFTGDLLMELGAAVELATVAAPQFFLPLACAANIAKNVAAVASTSTRAPIYKAFARGENIGDVTAKGECISNIADLLGTGLGIFISKKNPSLTVTFAVLSCGYLCCSYNEIKSVCLSTLNRARFKVAVQFFLETGRVPSLSEGNQKESIFTPPWLKAKPFALGARINEAFQSPHNFVKLLPFYQKEKYLVTYNSTKSQAFVLLKENASSDDVLKATFHAQVLEHMFQKDETRSSYLGPLGNFDRSELDIDATIKESCKIVPRLFESFKKHALSEGWIMGESLLNPGIVRLCLDASFFLNSNQSYKILGNEALLRS